MEVVGNDTLQDAMQMQMTLNTDVKYFVDTYKRPSWFIENRAEW